MESEVVEFLFGYSRSGQPAGRGQAVSRNIDGIGQVAIPTVDPADAPVVLRLSPLAGDKGRNPVLVRSIDGSLYRPVVGPGLPVGPCSRERFLAAATNPNSVWRDNPFRYDPMSPARMSFDNPRWPVDGYRGWLDDSDEVDRLGAAMASASRCAFVDGFAYRPVGTPWILVEVVPKSRFASRTWCFPEFDARLHESDWNVSCGFPTGLPETPFDRDDAHLRFPVDAADEADAYLRDLCVRKGYRLGEPSEVEVLEPSLLPREGRPNVGVPVVNALRDRGAWGPVLDLPAEVAALWYRARDAAAEVAGAEDDDAIARACDGLVEFFDSASGVDGFDVEDLSPKLRRTFEMARRWSLRGADVDGDEDALVAFAGP